MMFEEYLGWPSVMEFQCVSLYQQWLACCPSTKRPRLGLPRLYNTIHQISMDVPWCPGVPVPIKNLLRQHFPCCGHVGYLPVNNTWFGGPRGVGKTGLEAKQVFDDVMALEAAGCIAVEMECVPARVAAEITQRTKMLVFSMGSLARWPPLKQTKVCIYITHYIQYIRVFLYIYISIYSI